MISKHTKTLTLLLSLFSLMVTTSRCTSPKPTPDNRILGAPPTEKEDPFFFVTLPAEAKRAESRGMIGEDIPSKKKGISREPKSKESVGDNGFQEKKRIRCFSCVKVCDTASSCEDADSICGWGVGEQKESVILRATAECNGALDLARLDKRWKRIKGKCPIAQCQ